MTPFLRQVAAHYSDKQHLEDYCFVFPNRRSGQFFEKELVSQLTAPRIMPAVLTISDWIEQMSDLSAASTIDMVFLLYQAYCDAFGPAASEFDKFIYWVHIIITDFNDVDMAMADVNSLYTNLRDLRQIATDYIDPELKVEIGRIFNIQFTESDSFWNHPPAAVADDPTSPSAQYHTLWDKLSEIYDRFHALLQARGLATPGRLYRDLARRLPSMTANELGYERIVLVGFAALSVSQDKIFKSLREMNVADYWWDDASPAFDLEANAGGQLVRVFSKRYPAPAALDTIATAPPRIHAMAAPTDVGEAKWAFHLVEQMGLTDEQRRDDIRPLELPHVNLSNAINTAIVLPDENLFVPLLSSVPPGVGQMNVTLGYPMRHAGIVSLMHLVARAHRQATHSNTTNQWMFYREDVLDILSHPIIKSTFINDVLAISQAMEQSRDFNVSENTFIGTALKPLFTTVRILESKAEVLAYIDRLMEFVGELDRRVRSHDGTDNGLLPLQSAFNVHYADALRNLRQAIDESNHLPTEGTSVFYLIDRLTASLSVPFTGEPLEGLQLMGMLETRSLDFDNLIVLSMNERVFPSRRPMSSFIPDYLRAAHLMPTNAWHEAVMTFHFYRLLGRASDVMLIYNSSSQGTSSGEPSRFIAQLEMTYGLPVRHTTVDTSVSPAPELHIEVRKRPEMIEHYTLPGGTPPLSASAIKKYLKCPLMFYLRHVQHLRDDNDTGDFMDARTFGTVVHNTLQELYYPHVNNCLRTGSYTVTREMIDDFESRCLAATVVREVNRTYLFRSDDQLNQPLHGDALILLDTIKTYVQNVLTYDRQLIKEHGPIEVLECEVPHLLALDLNGLKVNFTFVIDRLDRVGGCVRLIDYKTGNDETKFTSADELMSTTSHKKHALMQLLLYCNALHQMRPEFDTVQPMIYKLRKMDESGMLIGPQRGEKHQYTFTPGDPVNGEFTDALHHVLAEMLDCETPFRQATSTNACKYCHFTEFCRRN